MPDVLPDSRLKDKLGTVMTDWAMPDGSTVRIEVEPVFCANCGKAYGHVPKENTTFAFYLCQPCFDTHGKPPGTVVSSDDAFRRKLNAEMIEKFGRPLTAEELLNLQENNRLGPIELLLRESPWRKPN